MDDVVHNVLLFTAVNEKNYHLYTEVMVVTFL